MHLAEELADNDPRLPAWFARHDGRGLGVGKLQFEESSLYCRCGHAAGAHFEMWPAVRRVTGDASYPYILPSPIQEGCDQCVGCGGLHINMDDQGNLA